jgi:hypothetical protein
MNRNPFSTGIKRNFNLDKQCQMLPVMTGLFVSVFRHRIFELSLDQELLNDR